MKSRQHLDLDLDYICEKLYTTWEIMFLPLCLVFHRSGLDLDLDLDFA